MPISLRDIWDYRELLYFLMWRDVKIRYKQTLLGITWVVLQPLLMAVIFTIFLGRLVHIPSNSLPYILFAYTGLVTWTFFSNSVTQAANSLVINTNLVTKIYFPRVIIPTAAIGARFVDFFVSFGILIVLMAYYRVVPGAGLLMLPVCVLVLCVLTLGFGFLFSALNVRYRDIGIVLPVAIQLWMFVSPVVYPVDLIPERWRWLYWLNPVAGVIQGMRSSLLNLPFDWKALGFAAAVAVAVLIYAMFAFKKMEGYFADVV